MVGVFRTVSKRRNSTKTGTGGTSVGLILKEGCSIIAPRIALKWDGATAPTAWNHVFIEDWDRTYWIDNWTYEDRQWIADCSVDVLASYKTTIGNAEKYILRAADDSDDMVIDTKYPAKAEIHSALMHRNTWPWAIAYDAGSIVMGIVGQGNTYSPGGVGYVVMSTATYQTLLNAVFNNANNIWSATSLGNDVGEALARFGDNWQKSVTSPYQFINSVRWFPFSITGGSAFSAKFGRIDSGVTVNALAASAASHDFSFDINTAYNGPEAWKNIEPFTEYQLDFPVFGTFSLPASSLYGCEYVTCRIVTDLTTGQGILYVEGHKNALDPAPRILTTVRANVGVDLDIAGQIRNTAQGFAGAVAAAGSIATAAAVPSPGSIASAVSAIGNVSKTIAPSAYNAGAMGSVTCALLKAQLTRYVRDPVDEDVAEHGKPYMQLDYIMLHSGYLLCADGDVEIAGTPGEAAQIAAYLTGGFFYE